MCIRDRSLIASGIDRYTFTFLTKDEKCFADFIPLSLGQIFLGLTKDKFSKPKHPIDLKDIPTFSDN